MINLAPMSDAAFAAFRDECTAAYARDNVRAGRWPAASAAERAQREFLRLLPQGLATPGHAVYEIREAQVGQTVGFLWVAEIEADGMRTGFVYSIHIHPEQRGRGYAKAAIDRLEALSRERGLASVALHVFSHNGAAQALYRSLGYGITGFNMLKPLRRDDE